THITNAMRLMSLPPAVIELIEQKKISTGHARALLGLSSPRAQIKAAQEIARRNMTVRQTEEIVKFEKEKTPVNKSKAPELLDLEDRLQKHFGSRAEVKRKRNGGTIEISFYNEEDLERILELFGMV
ncbi:MAG: ParB/RepB/Spo0J family partition protein, partial [Methanobacterium sp.]